MIPSACPPYDDLIGYADTGACEKLAGHDPKKCQVCGKHLREYDEIRGALRELQGLEDYSAESLREGDGSDRTPAMRVAVRIPTDSASRVLEMAVEARNHFHTDWGGAMIIAENAWQAACVLPVPQNRAGRSRHLLAEAEVLSALGISQTRNNRVEEGIVTLIDAAGHWEKLGEPAGLGSTLTNLAYSFIENKNLLQAEETIRTAIATLETIQQEFELAKAHHMLAGVLLNLGRFEAAKREIQEAVSIYMRKGNRNELAMALQIEGLIALEMGNPAAAAAAASQAAGVFGRLGNGLDEARCIWLLGRTQIAGAGDRAEGLANLERARRRFFSEGLWIEAGMILCQAGQALIEGGDRVAARTRLDELERQMPADRANAWVSEAARKLRERLADGDVASLSAEFGRLADALERLSATPSETAGPAH